VTIHFDINDEEIESQLTKLAEQQNKTVAEQAGELLANTLRERNAKLQKLREKLAVGEAQLDRGEGTDGESFFKGLLGK